MELVNSQIVGEGKPLVILHGFLGMADNWRTLSLRFAEVGYQVHVIDARNHGHSFHSSEFSYALMVEDLIRYMDFYHIDSAPIIGHSMGGKTTMLLAVTYPKRAERIVVVDMAPKYYPVHHKVILDALSTLDFSKIKTREEADKQLGKFIIEPSVRQFLLKNVYRKTSEELGLRINLPVLRERVAEIGTALPVGTVYNGETLFVVGGKSSYVLPEDMTLIKQHFPKAERVVIQDAGHWIQVEKPKEFFETTYQFLQK
jgi:abhydrolase domain-containing protein 11